MDRYDRYHVLKADIEQYTDLMNDEYGDALECLINFVSPEYLGDEFFDRILEEMSRQLAYLRKHCKIVEHKEFVPAQVVRYKVLGWDYE